MLQTMFFLFMMIMSIMFLSMSHPLSMGLILMMQTILIVLFSGILTKSFWFSYSLFLIFLGGMLILFMYMTSIASNEQFKNKISLLKLFYFILFSLLLMMLFYYLSQKLLFFNKIQNLENLKMIDLKMLSMENNLMLNKMYNFPMNMITILLINYLFLTLIATVKITNIFEGPLRPKN